MGLSPTMLPASSSTLAFHGGPPRAHHAPVTTAHHRPHHLAHPPWHAQTSASRRASSSCLRKGGQNTQHQVESPLRADSVADQRPSRIFHLEFYAVLLARPHQSSPSPPVSTMPSSLSFPSSLTDKSPTFICWPKSYDFRLSSVMIYKKAFPEILSWDWCRGILGNKTRLKTQNPKVTLKKNQLPFSHL